MSAGWRVPAVGPRVADPASPTAGRWALVAARPGIRGLQAR